MKLSWKNDWITILIAICLSLGGILSIISSEGGFKNGIPYLAMKQMIFLAAAILVYMILSYIDYKSYARFSLLFYVITLVLLAGVLIFGVERGGAVRWILIGSYQLQPSEHIKLLMVIVLARVLTRMRGQFNDRVIFLLALISVVPVMLLIAAEPDLGSALMLFMMFLIMSFASPVSWKITATFILIVTLLVPAAWPMMKDYQKNRIMTFVNPSMDPLGKGYQSNQSKIAIGSGGFTGKGLFKGTQNKLDFIPFQSTDFIFSIVGEEGGFIFSSLVIALYIIMLIRLGSIAARAPDLFGGLIVWGITGLFFLESFVNIGMTIGIMPVTGTPLPFMSSGVNSLIISYACIGVANSVYRFDISELRSRRFH